MFFLIDVTIALVIKSSNSLHLPPSEIHGEAGLMRGVGISQEKESYSLSGSPHSEGHQGEVGKEWTHCGVGGHPEELESGPGARGQPWLCRRGGMGRMAEEW